MRSFDISSLKKKAFYLALWLIIGLSPATAAEAGKKSFVAVLNSDQQAQEPKPGSSATGVARFSLDTATGMLCYNMTYGELDGHETATHLHGPAPAGAKAIILFGISPSPSFPSDLGSPKTGCVGPFENEKREWLENGLVYINIHTSLYPSGEIRGQILPANSNTGE